MQDAIDSRSTPAAVARAGLRDAPQVLPTGQHLDVTVSLRLPVAATPEQLLDWLRYHLGLNGVLHGDNPLRKHDMQGDSTLGMLPQVRLRLW